MIMSHDSWVMSSEIIRFNFLPDLTPAGTRFWAVVTPRSPLSPAPAVGDRGARLGERPHAKPLEKPVAVRRVPPVAILQQHLAVLDSLCMRYCRVKEDRTAALKMSPRAPLGGPLLMQLSEAHVPGSRIRSTRGAG